MISSAQATVLFQEGFETGDLRVWGLPIGTTCHGAGTETGNQLCVSQDVAHTGGFSLKCHYDPATSLHQLNSFPLVACGAMDASVGFVRNVYSRFWLYFVNFTFDSITTKHIYHISTASGNDGLESVWFHKNASPEVGADIITAQVVQCTNGGFDRDCGYDPNVGHVPFANNQWYCVETHVNAGSGTGAADGAIETWINGVQTINYQNRIVSFGPNGAYDIFRLYGQYGGGDRYYDDIVVADSRIGCGTTTAIPGTPANLNVTTP